MNEVIQPGLLSVEKYNACLNSTAQSLLDYGVDQFVEHIDDDDRELAPAENSFWSNNRTDL